MLAVKVMTGTMTSGNKSDIDKAFNLALDMANDGFFGLEYAGVTANKEKYEATKYSNWLTDIKVKKLIEVVQNASNEVEKILNESKYVLENLARALVKKKELSNSEIVAIIEGKRNV